MEIAKRITYDGQNYYLQSSGRYYQNGRQTVEERLLHRRIWMDHHGDIPDGMVVHHIDGDWKNNAISNLELKDLREHMREHTSAMMKNPQHRASSIQALRDNSHLAAEWHKSPEGLKWHSENGKRAWEKRQPTLKKCIQCGNEYGSMSNRATDKYCSHNCEQKYRNINKIGWVLRQCEWCGVDYLAKPKYGAKCCSYSCGSKNGKRKATLSELT